MGRHSGLLLGVGLLAAVAAVGLVLARPPGSPTDGVAASTLPAPLASTPGASLPPAMSVPELYAAFENGGRASSAGDPVGLSTIPAGDLVLPTGRVVAADVFLFTTEPFTQTLPAGRHPVTLLSSARDPDLPGDVAAAMIRVAPGAPITLGAGGRSGAGSGDPGGGGFLRLRGRLGLRLLRECGSRRVDHGHGWR